MPAYTIRSIAFFGLINLAIKNSDYDGEPFKHLAENIPCEIFYYTEFKVYSYNLHPVKNIFYINIKNNTSTGMSFSI
jgi:hypothetical protein